MTELKRDSDKNFMKRLWENYAIYFHMVGFCILVIFMVGNYWSKWQAQGAELDAHEIRIKALEQQSTQVIQRLDDIMDYLHVPQRRGP